MFFIFTVYASAQVETSKNESLNPIDKVYRSTEVDLKPQLKGGMYTLSMFLSENFNFPAEIKNKKITIFSSFIIETNGAMTDIKAFHITVKDYLTSNVDTIATEDEKINQLNQIKTMKLETVRVLKMFKKTWMPALKDGKSIRCLYNYPIHFNIE